MYKLLYRSNIEDNVQSVSSRTIEEILSLSVDAFNQNAELLEIQRDGKIFYTSCQIYKIINKAFY